MNRTDKLTAPVMIAPNLNAGVKIGDAWVTIGYSDLPPNERGRTRYRWEIIFADGTTESADDMRSGCQGGNLTDGLKSLLSYLSAAAESYRYNGNAYNADPDSNCSLFSERVVEFAYQNDDEISMTEYEIENPE
jgi:hypothetical protein